MHLPGVFELDIRPGDTIRPATVRIALQRYSMDDSKRPLITPECGSFEELEGQINALQDELDELRQRARRAFQATV
jgi:hypothetical protein